MYSDNGYISEEGGAHPFYLLANAYKQEIEGEIPLKGSPTAAGFRRDRADTLSEMFRTGYGWWGGWSKTEVATGENLALGLNALRTLAAVVRPEVVSAFERYARQTDLPANLQGHYNVVSTVLTMGRDLQGIEEGSLAEMQDVYASEYKTYASIMKGAGMLADCTFAQEYGSYKRMLGEAHSAGTFDYVTDIFPFATPRVIPLEKYEALNQEERSLLEQLGELAPPTFENGDDQVAALALKEVKNIFDKKVYRTDSDAERVTALGEAVGLLKEHNPTPKLKPLYEAVAAMLPKVIGFLDNGGFESVLWEEWMDESPQEPEEVGGAGFAPVGSGLEHDPLGALLRDIYERLERIKAEKPWEESQTAAAATSSHSTEFVNKVQRDMKLLYSGEPVTAIEGYEGLLGYKAQDKADSIELAIEAFSQIANILYERQLASMAASSAAGNGF